MTGGLPLRPKSQRLLSKKKNNNKQEQFQLYKQRAKNITSAVELLPGLNDISDAFEALPLDIIKYFTLLKEIDAKCIKTMPQINNSIENYIENLHNDTSKMATKSDKIRKLTNIRDKIHEIIPCLEEKMHVTSVATDLLHKHMYRINNDYKLIIQNNEIPESIRIGPLNHPAMIMDLSGPSDLANPNRSAQSQRSESRREALAAKKANKDSGEDEESNSKKRKGKEPVNDINGTKANSAGRSTNGGAKKRQRKEIDEPVPNTTSTTSVNSNVTTTTTNTVNTPPSSTIVAKKRGTKPKREDDSQPGASSPGNEPTYCYCNQVSFGEMVGCDGDECKREWFHLPCIGFKNPPKGKWYCDECLVKMKKNGKKII